MRALRIAITLLNLAVAVTAMAWSALIFDPDDVIDLNTVATRMLSGQSFPAADLAALIPKLAAAEDREACNPLEVRSATIIRVALYQEAVRVSDNLLVDERMKALNHSVERAFRCIPTESFLWFVRYWLMVARGAPEQDRLKSLIESYRLGPNEGWIALRRNIYALAVYDSLPEEVGAQVRDEFAGMVNGGLLKDAASNLRNVSPDLQRELIAGLSKVKRQQLLVAFDRILREGGSSLPIPGVPQRETRPWRN